MIWWTEILRKTRLRKRLRLWTRFLYISKYIIMSNGLLSKFKWFKKLNIFMYTISCYSIFLFSAYCIMLRYYNLLHLPFNKHTSTDIKFALCLKNVWKIIWLMKLLLKRTLFANEMTVGMKKVFEGMIHFWPVW